MKVKDKLVLPLLSLGDRIVFPHEALSLQVDEENRKLFEENLADGKVALSFITGGKKIRGEDLSSICVESKIFRSAIPGQVIIEGIRRIKLEKLLEVEPYFKAEFSLLEEEKERESWFYFLAEKTVNLFEHLLELEPLYPKGLSRLLRSNLTLPGKLADLLGANLFLSLKEKEKILEQIKIKDRLEKIVEILNRKIEEKTTESRMSISHELKTRSSLMDAQELEIEQLKKRIQDAALPLPAERKAFLGAERLRLISPASGEFSLIQEYIDWMISLPWSKSCAEEIEVERLEKVLDREYFGQKKTKEHIYEYFSIRQLKKDIKGTFLCFVGPPGTGKASLSRSIALALNRKFVRLSVAGFSRSQQIKGERFGLSGSSPGAIIKNIREAGCNNPLFLIEEVDKLGEGANRTEVVSSLLEVLDPEHNSSFIDDYLGLTFDLSEVLFIATAQNIEGIPNDLLELFEVIEFTGFIEEEKLQIAKRFIVPTQVKRHGLSEEEVQITDEAIKKIIWEYAIEEGLRNLQVEIETICRKIARMKASASGDFWRITPENLADYLGTPIYIPEIAEKKPEVGVVCGLAWTPSGGDIMLIEGLKMRGSGQILSTGQLGVIIQESIQIAHSYIRSQAQLLGINYKDFTDFDIHIHFPSGTIPKDGPSAGIAISLVIASVMSEKPIRNDLAMSGEVSLRGNILPIGGVKEKLSASRRVGIKKIILPKANQKSLPDLPEELISELELIWVERMEEVFEKALIGFEEQKRLQQVIKKEVEKLSLEKKRRKSKTEDK